MKRVSLKVAKALKEAGYPQTDLSCWYDAFGTVFTVRPRNESYYVAPTYLEVWLWLWRKKDLRIRPNPVSIMVCDNSVRTDHKNIIYKEIKEE